MEQAIAQVITQILNSGAISGLLLIAVVYQYRDAQILKGEMKQQREEFKLEVRQQQEKFDQNIKEKDAVILQYAERIAKLEGKHDATQTMVDKFTRIEELLEVDIIKTSQKRNKKSKV